VDANGDGICEAGELKELSSLGIIELDLHAQAGTAVNHGNVLGLVASYKTSDGHSHAMADVWFTKDQGTQSGHADSGTPAVHAPSEAAPPIQAQSDARPSVTHDGPIHSIDGQTQANLKHSGISAADLLSDRGQDLLVSDSSLHVPHAPFAQIDHTRLTDEPQNTPLI
jgi:trimeric autotransporter adhesin